MVSIQKDISLKNFSNYKIGGPAKYFCEVSSVEELREILKEVQDDNLFILGGGTNVLISDEGFSGLVIHLNIKFIKKDPSKSSGQVISVGAGVLIEDLLNFCVQNSLSGLEWAGGLPGTIGGAVRGNAGAFGGETKDSVFEVTSLKCNDVLIHHYKDNRVIKIIKRKNKECKFTYRSSIFKNQKESESQSRKETEVIISVVLKLRKGDKDLIKKQIEEKISYRRQRHPLEFPNIGSIFKNIPIEKVPQKLLEQLKDSIKNDPFPLLPTAKLLALAGLKGKKRGGAMVSTKHPNFIVNFNNASSTDVKNLIYKIKEIIKEKYGLELEEEITYLS